MKKILFVLILQSISIGFVFSQNNLCAAVCGANFITIYWDANTSYKSPRYSIRVDDTEVNITSDTQCKIINLESCRTYTITVRCLEASSERSITASTTSSFTSNITISNSVAFSPANYVVQASNSIVMVAGANIKPINGQSFNAKIVPCGSVQKKSLAYDNHEVVIGGGDYSIENTNSKTDFGQVLIYPNPASDIVNINYPNFKKAEKAILTDILGQVVFEITINSELTRVDLSSLSSGLYTISISNEKNVSSYKIIKK